jgi:tRNA (guanine-N7-)-methyltransferase
MQESRHGVERSADSVRRPAASFRMRQRRLSPKRQAEFDEWIQRWSLAIDGPVLDWAEVFGREGDVVLDIGFGHGESTIEMAAVDPATDVVGVEVHTPGVVTVLDAIEHRDLRHIRVVHGDVLPFLDRVGAESLAGVRIYFPDPWTKRRNHHRRLVGPDVIAALTDRLRPGGTLHLATDIAGYAEEMQRVCDAESRLTGGIVERPEWRPLTRFEQRGLDVGRHPVDLLYTRCSSGQTPAAIATR